MSYAVPQTPQRPLPGAYVQTPAPSFNYQSRLSNPPSFQSSAVATHQQHGAQGQDQALTQQRQQVGQQSGRPQPEELRPIERASRTINQTLKQELNYPSLDEYVIRKFPCPAKDNVLTSLQKVLLPTMTSLRSLPGHRFRKLNLTTYRRRSLPNTITLRCPP